MFREHSMELNIKLLYSKTEVVMCLDGKGLIFLNLYFQPSLPTL